MAYKYIDEKLLSKLIDDIKKRENNKADIEHTHSQYALGNHTHSQYAQESHIHSPAWRSLHPGASSERVDEVYRYFNDITKDVIFYIRGNLVKTPRQSSDTSSYTTIRYVSDYLNEPNWGNPIGGTQVISVKRSDLETTAWTLGTEFNNCSVAWEDLEGGSGRLNFITGPQINPRDYSIKIEFVTWLYFPRVA